VTEGIFMLLQEEINRELAHEERALAVGAERHQAQINRNRENGIEDVSNYGRDLEKRCIGPFSDAINTWLIRAVEGPGKGHSAWIFLKNIEAPVAAFIAAKVVIQGVSTTRSYHQVTNEIGKRIEDELRYRFFEEQNKALLTTVLQNLKKHPNGHKRYVRRSTLNHAMKKFKVIKSGLTTQQRVHIGEVLLDVFRASCGLVDVVHQRIGKRQYCRLAPTAELTEFVNDFTSRSLLLSPFFIPTLIPPKPWTNPQDGGYWSRRMAMRPLIKTKTKGIAKEIQSRQMPLVYQAVNALQDTAWRVNGTLLSLMRQVWESGLIVKGMPAASDQPYPAEPDFNTEPKLWANWKRTCASIYRENLTASTRRIQARRIFEIAEQLKDEASLYFPVQLDFRGRFYFIPQALNPQGSDQAKALLTFAQGKPLGPDGAWWLAIHVANCFGVDKVSFADRVTWTHTNSAKIWLAASDPHQELFWTEADKPWQFLAAALEWKGFCDAGSDQYVSSLPIMMDGSCNGLQHFSAMLRDPICGKQVNLTPSDKPADIYAEVAHETENALAGDASTGGKLYANLWIDFGITRKLCKRPVMVLPYGGTRESCRNYIYEHVVERITEGEDNPFGNELKRAVSYLATVVWQAMHRVVIGPQKAMAWLKASVKVINEHCFVSTNKGRAKRLLPINWTTPSGFLVQQAYHEVRSRRIKTHIDGQVVRPRTNVMVANLDGKKQVSAISPNFVHALDAASLCLTIAWGKANGLGVFSAVHDSYGTLAADTSTLQSCLRHAFVSLYEDCDPLEMWANEVSTILPPGTSLPPLPKKGILDIRGVLSSDYFFA
jgi:DNA-directed RNA polymerase